MKRFSELYAKLDQTTKTTVKVDALVQYFRHAEPEDAAWAVYFLGGERLRRLVAPKLLRQWAAEAAGIEDWLFEECYEIAGDLAEAITLVLPTAAEQFDLPLHRWVTERLQPLRDQTEAQQKRSLRSYWNQLGKAECFVMHKLISGSFRVGVSKKLVVKALADYSGIDAEVIAHRLMGDWEPTAAAFQEVLDPDTNDARQSRPYPVFLANPVVGDIQQLGDICQWQAEWKWDGIRAQLIQRDGQVFIWSRGEELMTDRFPELVQAATNLPSGTVIDGEIVAWKDGGILPFSEMQRRIGRKKLGKKILSEVPVSMIAFDLLELEGIDVRQQNLAWRRAALENLLAWHSDFRNGRDSYSQDTSPANGLQRQLTLVSIEPTRGEDNSSDPVLQLSQVLTADSWSQLHQFRERSRENQAEGLMLKRRNSPYRVGRPRGDWWKWKIEPYTIDAVLIYAQRGHGRRASLYSDYTFAVWDNDQLVPFAKAYSGLTDAEMRRVDRFVRQNTLDRFGPVRRVTPQLVFELAFENIQESSRHKSGIAVRFPRISRWREDLGIKDADSLESIKRMMASDQCSGESTDGERERDSDAND